MTSPLRQFLTTWSVDAFVAVNLVVFVGVYLVGVARVNSRVPTWPWPKRHSAAFLGGAALLAVAYLGPLPAWSHTFFWAHMSQHLIVMMVAAPLLVLGSPVTLLFRASSDANRRRWVVPALRSKAVRLFTNPVLTWLLFAVTLIATHFTPFYDWALRNHDADQFIEQPLYLVVAFLYYFPLIGSNLQPRRPAPAVRLASMALMMVPEAIVGAVIFFSSVPLYSTYVEANRPFGPSVMIDQHLAGAVMWALIMVIDSFWMMDMAVVWFRAEERKGHRLDMEIAAEQAAAEGVTVGLDKGVAP